MTATGAAEVQVRYSETDQMGVAHHRNYFTWFEVARTEFLRESGLTYRELEAQDIFMPVLEVSCRYRKPARYDDVLLLETRFSRSGRARLRFDYRVLRDREAIAEGFTVHVTTDARGVPRRIPAEILALAPPVAGEMSVTS